MKKILLQVLAAVAVIASPVLASAQAIGPLLGTQSYLSPPLDTETATSGATLIRAGIRGVVASCGTSLNHAALPLLGTSVNRTLWTDTSTCVARMPWGGPLQILLVDGNNDD